MTKAIETGGLGIRNMRNMNIAFMAKLGWRFLNAANDLWARVLQTKYARGKVEICKLIRKLRASNASSEKCILDSRTRSGTKMFLVGWKLESNDKEALERIFHWARSDY